MQQQPPQLQRFWSCWQQLWGQPAGVPPTAPWHARAMPQQLLSRQLPACGLQLEATSCAACSQLHASCSAGICTATVVEGEPPDSGVGCRFLAPCIPFLCDPHATLDLLDLPCLQLGAAFLWHSSGTARAWLAGFCPFQCGRGPARQRAVCSGSGGDAGITGACGCQPVCDDRSKQQRGAWAQ